MKTEREPIVLIKILFNVEATYNGQTIHIIFHCPNSYFYDISDKNGDENQHSQMSS